jgi:hypothetical protein
MLTESVDRTEEAAARLLAATETAIELRGPRLISATAAILDEVRAQLLAARVDPDAALDALRQKSTASVTGIRTAAKEVTDAAGNTAEIKKATEASMGQATDAGAPAAVTAAGATATAAENRTAKLAANAQRILDLVKLGTQCLGGKAPAESDPEA